MVCSKSFFKPDKIDLAFVVFLLFIMVCNITFCAEIENVSVSHNPNLNAELGTFVSGSNGVAYFQIEKGYRYYIHIDTTNPNAGVQVLASNLPPALGVIYNRLHNVTYNDPTYVYNAFDNSYLYLSYYVDVPFIAVTRERITNMGGVVNILSNDVGTNQFWNVFTFAIPFILVVVIVVFGFFIIRRLTKKESKGDIRF